MVIKTIVNNNECSVSNIGNKNDYKISIVWQNVIFMIILHISGIYGYYIILAETKWQTIAFMFILGIITSVGVQSGSHRLWSHRTYKAKLPLRLFYAFGHTSALQSTIYIWCRDHRVHHKYTDTDADPHNSNRGFFFSHMGWLLCRRHPDVKQKGRNVDTSDLWADPVVRYQHKYYIPLIFIVHFLIPAYIPYLLWNESKLVGFFAKAFLTCYSLHVTFLVNSAAHFWGYKPYDQSIRARECTIRTLLQGEGFHNYHHTFPMDYTASEFGSFDVYNIGTVFIDFCAYIGLAYDLKRPSIDMIKKKIERNNSSEEYNSSPNRLIEWAFGAITFTWLIWSLYLIRFLISI